MVFSPWTFLQTLEAIKGVVVGLEDDFISKYFIEIVAGMMSTKPFRL